MCFLSEEGVQDIMEVEVAAAIPNFKKDNIRMERR